MSTLLFLGILLVLVAVHELGHFLVAKACGVGIKTFSIGFGPTLFKYKKNKTTYQLAAIPLGGYVSMAGENTKDGPSAEFAESELFYNKSRWRRLIIVLAGPISNFIMAFALMPLVFYVGIVNPEYNPSKEEPIIQMVLPGSPAMEAGLRPTDKIIKIEGRDNPLLEDTYASISSHCGHPMSLTVLRGGEEVSLIVTPKVKDTSCYLGVQFAFGKAPIVRYGWKDSIIKGTKSTSLMFGQFAHGLSMIVGGDISPKESIGGPLQMVEMTGVFKSMGLSMIIFYIVLLNINLGIMNLFPILPLDGGHVFCIALEYIGLKKVVDRLKGVMSLIGFVLLILLMVFAFSNDISNYLPRLWKN